MSKLISLDDLSVIIDKIVSSINKTRVENTNDTIASLTHKLELANKRIEHIEKNALYRSHIKLHNIQYNAFYIVRPIEDYSSSLEVVVTFDKNNFPDYIASETSDNPKPNPTIKLLISSLETSNSNQAELTVISTSAGFSDVITGVLMNIGSSLDITDTETTRGIRLSFISYNRVNFNTCTVSVTAKRSDIKVLDGILPFSGYPITKIVSTKLVTGVADIENPDELVRSKEFRRIEPISVEDYTTLESLGQIDTTTLYTMPEEED